MANKGKDLSGRRVEEKEMRIRREIGRRVSRDGNVVIYSEI